MTEPTLSDRGFAHWEMTWTDYGAEVRIYESSAAQEPHIWLRIDQKEFANLETSEAFAHMSLEQAEEIRDKLDAAITFTRERWM